MAAGGSRSGHWSALAGLTALCREEIHVVMQRGVIPAEESGAVFWECGFGRNEAVAIEERMSMTERSGEAPACLLQP